MSNYLAQGLAAFVVSVKQGDVAEAALKQAELVVLDVVSSASAGFTTPAAVAARRTTKRVMGGGSSPIWQTGERLSLPGAIFANVSAATALDLDDGHRLACGHPAAGVVPVVTAVAEREGCDGAALLTAIAVGYEVGVRVSAARDIGKIHTSATGQWLSYATAAATGRLLGLDAERMGHALAIAGTLWPNMLVNGWSKQKGNSIKEGMPWSAMTGFMAAELASDGFTGARDVLDDTTYAYDSDVILSGTGTDWAITRNYFKYYSACRHAHPSIDIILDLLRSGDLPEEIEQIDVYTYNRALYLNNYPAPSNIEDAQYSLPFCIALAAVLGRDAVALIAEDHLSHPAVLKLAHRIKLHHDPAVQSYFPAQTRVRLTITAQHKKIDREVEYCGGDWQTGDNSNLLHEKFDRLTSSDVEPDWRLRLPGSIRNLRSQGPRELFALLGASVRADV